jgi:hypothetical protein
VANKPLAPLLLALVALALPASSELAMADETGLTEEFLSDPENIRLGEELWASNASSAPEQALIRVRRRS